MGAQPWPDGDELRARHYLRRLGARPIGHQENPMPHDEPRPITPTRIIPAGATLPERPPEPGEIPPWYEAPPPPPPPPPAPVDPGPRTVEIRHVHEVLLVVPEPEPESEPGLLARLWDWLCTWRMISAILAALLPWAYGQSPVGVWSHVVHQARTEASIGAAYIVAVVAVTAAWALDRHSGRWLPRMLLVTAGLGSLGVLHWYDPILALTGVQYR